MVEAMDKKKLEREIELKSELIVEGTWVEDAALEGVGKVFSEQAHWLFDWSHAFPDKAVPNDMELPLGTCPQVRMDRKSAFLVTKEDGQLILKKNGKFITTVKWLKRPKYYDMKLPDGSVMLQSAQMRGKDMLAISFSSYCEHWKHDAQCRYCNLNATNATYENIMTVRSADNVGVAAKAALKEMKWNHMIMTGGNLPDNKDIDLIVRILESIRKETGLKTIPGVALPHAKKDFSIVDKIKEAGIEGFVSNIEIFNPRWFAAVCPGKQDTIGYETWLKYTEYAAQVFGKGKVHTCLVTGIEPKEDTLEGVHWLGERGVVAYILTWSPFGGSKLEGHRSPSPEWYLDLADKASDIMLETGTLTEASSLGGCWQCSTNLLLYDLVRLKKGDPEKRTWEKKGFDPSVSLK